MFSKTTEYALRAVIYIAQKGTKEQKVGIMEIAAAIGSPQSFTAKTLQQLSKKPKVICSVPGPNGGFYMTDKERNLPVQRILDAMNETDVIQRCILGLPSCSEAKPCPMHFEYKKIKQDLLKMFQGKTIRELSDDLDGGHVFISRKNL